MSRKLYLECASGISGDMFVASLLDLGADVKMLEDTLHSLNLDGFETEIRRVSKNGLDACDFHVVLDEEHENHDHDMGYLHGHGDTHENGDIYGHEDTYVHGHTHSHEDKHVNGHTHGHGNMPERGDAHGHTHVHRGLAEILPIIESAKMGSRAKETAVHIFEILAQAEAKAHGVSINEVHFHEVGAVDSIVDIIAAAVCLDSLDVDEVIVPVLQEGTGFVRCQHGMIPVPVPAVAAIVQEHGLPLHINKIEGEFVTPTGAAIVAAIRTKSRLPEEFTIVKTGIGAGKRTYERPSILRAMLIQEKHSEKDYIYKLESNIDDCTGEALGYVMERLLDAGALDVNYMPVYMKKNRPAYQLNVVCKEEDIEKLETIIFRETTTIGIRRQRMERSVLKREVREVQTSLGKAMVKICSLPSGERAYPEYDSVAALGRESGLAWQETYQLILREYQEKS